MRKANGISTARTYGELAHAIYLKAGGSAKLQQVAICDSLGLWHTYPGKEIYPFVKDFNLRIGNRILLKTGTSKTRAPGKLLAEITELTTVKLEALDLAAKLRRFELIASAEMNEARRRDREQRKNLKRSADDKLRFFSTYSHDLKTPLSLLTMPLESLVVNDNRLPPSLRLQLEKIKIAIYNVLRTVGHSLDAAKLMTRNRRSILLPYDFSAFVLQVAEVYAIIFESYGMKLTTEIQNAVVAEIDPIQMEKVINNLLSNSIKHNLPGGTTHISLRAMVGKAELKISDDGLGAAPTLRQPLSRTNPWVLSSHGYGLGIVRELLRSNRAQLKIETRKGVGTSVVVSLPAVHELAQTASNLRAHNFYYTMHEVELLASERTQLSRRKRTG